MVDRVFEFANISRPCVRQQGVRRSFPEFWNRFELQSLTEQLEEVLRDRQNVRGALAQWHDREWCNVQAVVQHGVKEPVRDVREQRAVVEMMSYESVAVAGLIQPPKNRVSPNA